MYLRPIHLAVSLLTMCAMVLFATPRPVGAAASTTTQSTIIPIAFEIVACEEPVLLSGNLHEVTHITIDSAGNTHVHMLTNAQGVTGVGLVSGTQYRGTGATESTINDNTLPFETTRVNNFRIIGQGPVDNLLVHATIHTTINANGEVTAEVVQESVTCQG